MNLKNDSRFAPPELLRLGERIAVLPVIHGSGQFALTVRRWMLEHDFDCIAVPLPESFRDPTEAAILDLPRPSIVIQPAAPKFTPPTFQNDYQPYGGEAGEDAMEEDDADSDPASYVPIDPCQPVIMAIRAAMGEHIPRAYIDLETNPFLPFSTVMPDPFAVRHVSAERFAAAVLPSLPRPPDRQTRARILHMAARLAELEQHHQRILYVTSVLQWPWVREAYTDWFSRDAATKSETSNALQLPEPDDVLPAERFNLDPRTLMFLFGELPYITGLYERARRELDDDEDLQIDGVKELLIAARSSYRSELKQFARRITPLHLSKCLQYIRNLSLISRRMTPDLITIVTAAQQIMGDQYALHVAQLANQYPYAHAPETGSDADPAGEVKMGIDQAQLPDGQVVSMVNRLPGPPITWRTLHLKRKPSSPEKNRWKYQWNPYTQCSYPPEDERIENFRTRVFDRAKAIIGNDLARTEKFTTSVKDGIDIRDTLRHWYDRQIYVKVIPPSRGTLDACVMLFDSPSDPRDYSWRTTWFAEHKDESTLAFYATHFGEEMVGPGIGLSRYGGAMFLYPPVVIPDIWGDPRLDYTETLEERLIAAACMHSAGRQVALLSALPPGGGWRRLARRHRKTLVHVPLSSFSDEQVQQLRMVHVLNGREVRSYAEEFIRRV
ncbi:hypothetical protein FYK55_15530 [Roseiconus nitratireducens]|uniref:Uncharacterized protein n=1 Tax=Roseiconus nitratireducens TaxID=2605748 RepID=A0A5M6D4F1_9BACT|nr:hypothetical protein [Roseiconus nitratireducens]KAA5542213.1 hypothetical protein FYK55_15530 [Roseiconus nitratireducens]